MTENHKTLSDSEDSAVDEYEESDLLKEFSGKGSPCYITVETEDGGIEQVQIETNDKDDDFSALSSYYPVGEIDQQDLEAQHFNNKKQKPSKLSLKERKKASRNRIISKRGDCNVQLYRVSKKRRQFIKDVFTTCVDMKWRYTLLAFTASFLVSWLLFAAVWYIISYVHGDFEEDHLPDRQAESGWKPCVLATNNFASSFLFSVETQHTIGYGGRQTTEECPEAIILQCIQSIVGVMIQACMAGIVFAKLARAKQRSNTIMFSRNAVVTLRNGHLYLLFRVGNMRSSHLLQAHLRAQIVHKVVTEEGESVHFHQEELKVGTQLDGEEDRALLLWPATYSHKIDRKSPLWNLGPKDLLSSKFEIIVIFEGIVEATGNPVQARSSYVPNEILWAHRFENMVSYAKHKGVYAVDCSSMNQVAPDPKTPRLSAKDIMECKLRKSNNPRYRSVSTSSIISSISPNKKMSQIMLPPGLQRSRISTLSAIVDTKTKKEDTTGQELQEYVANNIASESTNSDINKLQENAQNYFQPIKNGDTIVRESVRS